MSRALGERDWVARNGHITSANQVFCRVTFLRSDLFPVLIQTITTVAYWFNFFAFLKVSRYVFGFESAPCWVVCFRPDSISLVIICCARQYVEKHPREVYMVLSQYEVGKGTNEDRKMKRRRRWRSVQTYGPTSRLERRIGMGAPSGLVSNCFVNACLGVPAGTVRSFTSPSTALFIALMPPASTLLHTMVITVWWWDLNCWETPASWSDLASSWCSRRCSIRL